MIIILRLLEKKTYHYSLLFIGILFIVSSSYSSHRYFLCGPDEDGCYEGIYQYCSCILYNDIEANNPYCLNFDTLTCTPLSQVAYCNPSFIHKNQCECLATIFQSEPTPPCHVTTLSFCLKEHSGICDPNGQPDSCHFDM